MKLDAETTKKLKRIISSMDGLNFALGVATVKDCKRYLQQMRELGVKDDLIVFITVKTTSLNKDTVKKYLRESNDELTFFEENERDLTALGIVQTEEERALPDKP